MIKFSKKKKNITLIIILICAIIMLIIFVTKMSKLPKRSNGTEIDQTIEIYDTSFKKLENSENALYVYDIFEIINKYLDESSSNSKEILYNLLDKEYIKYFSVNKKNVQENLNDYLHKKFVVKDIKIAKVSGSNTVYLVNTVSNETEYEFIIKTDVSNSIFSVFFPNYIEQYGLDNYIANVLVSTENTISSSEYNTCKYKNYTDVEIVKKYSEILKSFGFDYVYENYISTNTKEMYSYNELKDFFEDENTYFQRPVVVDLAVTSDESYSLNTYKFKDRKMNMYTISQENCWKFNIDIKIVKEEKTVQDDGGLLEIIEQ